MVLVLQCLMYGPVLFLRSVYWSSFGQGFIFRRQLNRLTSMRTHITTNPGMYSAVDHSVFRSSALAAWCRQALVSAVHDSKSPNPIEISVGHCQEIFTETTPSTNSDTPIKRDVSSPRSWLEQYPDGVYTVLRVERESANCTLIWGLDFHLDRLEQSYQKSGQELLAKSTLGDDPRPCLKQARQDTRNVLGRLLQEADWHANAKRNEYAQIATSNLLITTILWHPRTKQGQQRGDIQVRAHVTELAAKTPTVPTTPIAATLATIRSPPPDEIWTTSSLPNRRPADGLAECKVSSWCRERKPLEQHFQLPYSGTEYVGHEIILTQPVQNVVKNNRSNKGIAAITTTHLQLLEGLTSNLFLVYPNHVVRTAPTSVVLPGFARNMTLACLHHLGYTVEVNTTISVVGSDFAQALSSCQEVFVTSSIKLVVPVHALFADGRMVWSQSQHEQQQYGKIPELPLAQRLLQEILKRKREWVGSLPCCMWSE